MRMPAAATALCYIAVGLNSAEARAASDCRARTPAWAQEDIHGAIIEIVDVDAAGRLRWKRSPTSASRIRRKLNAAHWRHFENRIVAFEMAATLDCNRIERIRSVMAGTVACSHGRCTELEPLPPEVGEPPPDE